MYRVTPSRPRSTRQAVVLLVQGVNLHGHGGEVLPGDGHGLGQVVNRRHLGGLAGEQQDVLEAVAGQDGAFGARFPPGSGCAARPGSRSAGRSRSRGSRSGRYWRDKWGRRARWSGPKCCRVRRWAAWAMSSRNGSGPGGEQGRQVLRDQLLPAQGPLDLLRPGPRDQFPKALLRPGI